MVNTSKILTVSYGTFSCTLEGFDDSFETMKAIAEYFRDLASDDRYFGAEPPTPDAEMLARIAEREISRRVEARDDNGRIVLRAGTPAALTGAADPSAAEAPERSVASPARDAAERSATDQDSATRDSAADNQDVTLHDGADAEDDVWAEPEIMPTVDTDAESVAAKLRRIRAVASPAYASHDDAAYEEEFYTQDFLGETVADLDAALEEDDAREAAAPAMPDAAPSAETAPADASAQPEAEPEARASDGQTAEAQTAEAQAETPEAHAPAEPIPFDVPAVETAIDRDTAPAAEEMTAQGEDHATEGEDDDLSLSMTSASETADAAGDDSVATLGQHAAAPVAEDLVTEDLAVQPEAPTVTQDSDEASAPVPPHETAAEDGSGVADDADIADDAVLARLGRQADTAEDLPAEAATESPAAAMSAAPAVPQAAAQDEDEDETAPALSPEADSGDDDDIDLSDAGPVEDTLAQLMADALRDDDATPGDATDFDDALTDAARADAAPGDEDAPQDADGTQDSLAGPVTARVVKMKRADLEQAIAAGTLSELSDDSTLSAEAEAELQRELAEVEAELGRSRSTDQGTPLTQAPAPGPLNAGRDDDDAGQDDEADTRATPAAAKENPRPLVPEVETQAERIFEEADNQLDAPESHERRNAMQHLRAAVAATRAEKNAGGNMGRDVDDQPYRLDLESAVRPHRPKLPAQTRSERPSERRAAPLKLVAEQRVDTPAPAPVQPRRVSRADLMGNAAPAQPRPADADSFGDYARKMGAHDLPDLLEAAAAYMSDIEGQPQFSRPMLMQKLREIDADGFSREEGLRSFGQLLRQGKLQKLKGGRFTVTDETEFRQAG